MPHIIGQNGFVVAQEVIPGRGDREVAFHAQLVNSRNEGAVLAMGNQQDELVIAYIGGTGDDVVNQRHVGLIVQRDGSRHTHVHVGMTAVHGAGEHGGAGLLRHLLGQADGVEAVQAVGAVRAVLLNGAQGQDRYVVDFLGIGDVHGSGVLIKEHGISFVQLEFSLLLQFCHDNRFLS